MAKKKIHAAQPSVPQLAAIVPEEAPPPRSKSLVFISHDSRDGNLAEAFSNLLSDVTGGTLKSFRSSDRKGTAGIEFGAEWYKAIMDKLADATDVVALLTKRSIDRPWILYEAGVAKGKLETIVFGIAIGVPLQQVSTGPFGQFQNCADDEDSLTKLVLQLIRRNPEASPREEAVRMQVKIFLENVARLVKDEGKGTKQKQPDAEVTETQIAKLFEEVKAMVQQLPDQVEERVTSAARREPFGKRRLHPMMLEELLFFDPAFRELPEGAASAWLMLISMLRDEVPWLYEPGLELYRALRSGKPGDIASARESFQRLVRVSLRGPWRHRMMRPDDEHAFMFMHHLPELLEKFLSEVEASPKPKVKEREAPGTEKKE
jgi:hypothetical protein